MKALICSSGDDAIYVLRRLRGFRGDIDDSRLSATASEKLGLVDALLTGKDCPVSTALTEADRADLLRIKQAATEKAGK
jgi:hypothetical protein